MLEIKNSVAVITGGASGIGRAAVTRFLEEGSRVAVIDRDAKACRQITHEIPNLAGTFVADVSNEQAVIDIFKRIDGIFGEIDILINNAGISLRHAFLDITAQDWQKVIETNLNGVFYVAQQAGKRMWEQGRGVIINMGSTNGMIGYPYYADYNASKAGVIELTRSMALELAPKIRVMVVCPGYVLTPMQEVEYSPEMMEEVNRKIPLGRHAKPEEIAALLAFLASDEAPYMTGHPIVIDGGEIAGGLASR